MGMSSPVIGWEPRSVRVLIEPGTPGRCAIWILSITWSGKGRFTVMITNKPGFSSTTSWLPSKVWTDAVVRAITLITLCRLLPIHHSPTGEYPAGLFATLDALVQVWWRRSSQRDCTRRTGHRTRGYLAASNSTGAL